FFSSRRRHTRFSRDWSSDVCSSDLVWLRGACVVLAIVFGVGLLATVTDPGDSGSVHPSGSGGAGTSSSFERTDGTGGRSSTAGRSGARRVGGEGGGRRGRRGVQRRG